MRRHSRLCPDQWRQHGSAQAHQLPAAPTSAHGTAQLPSFTAPPSPRGWRHHRAHPPARQQQVYNTVHFQHLLGSCTFVCWEHACGPGRPVPCSPAQHPPWRGPLRGPPLASCPRAAWGVMAGRQDSCARDTSTLLLKGGATAQPPCGHPLLLLPGLNAAGRPLLCTLRLRPASSPLTCPGSPSRGTWRRPTRRPPGRRRSPTSRRQRRPRHMRHEPAAAAGAGAADRAAFEEQVRACVGCIGAAGWQRVANYTFQWRKPLPWCHGQICALHPAHPPCKPPPNLPTCFTHSSYDCLVVPLVASYRSFRVPCKGSRGGKQGGERAAATAAAQPVAAGPVIGGWQSRYCWTRSLNG